MKLYRVILPVGNIDEAEKFYSSILQQHGVRVSPGRHYFDLEGTILACYDPKADGDDDRPDWRLHFNQYIYIAVDDLQAVFEAARRSNPEQIDDGITLMPWGERLFYLRDPWRNPVCFVDRTTVFLGEEKNG